MFNKIYEKRRIIESFLIKYSFYILRWQMSTPILAVFTGGLTLESFQRSMLANFVGALIFFWVDRIIFKQKINSTLWEIRHDAECVDCGAIRKGYRIVKTKNYDKMDEENPKFRCGECSKIKTEQLKQRGVIIKES